MFTKSGLLRVVVVLILGLLAGGVFAQPPEEMTGSKPPPELRNLAYGDHERHVLDLWKAKSDVPSPLLIYFHGGGFYQGDKWGVNQSLLEACLELGISVASANYRLTNVASYPAPMLDAARAVQFLRLHAAEYNLDPTKFAVAGGSAGAGISQWIAFHDDLADPDNTDPVLRQSSRVSAVGTIGGQSSYDPRFIREVVGGRAHEHKALPLFFGITLDELDTPKAYKLYEDSAAVTHLSKDDPPIFAYYYEPWDALPPSVPPGPELYYPDFGKPIEGQPKPGQGIHHPFFGKALKERMDPLGLTCVLRHSDDFAKGDAGKQEMYREMAAFFHKYLSAPTTAATP